MRVYGGVAAAFAAALQFCVAAAWASDEARPLDGPRFLLFSTTDVWNHGGFVHSGLVWSSQGVDHEGFALKVLFGGGTYRYVSGALDDTEVTGQLVAAAILPGWRFVRGKFIATLYAGIDMQDHRLSPDDPSAGLRGSYTGVRFNAEVWSEPTPSTMVAADGMISTIDATYNARIAYGWRALGWFYFGPEAQAFAAGDNYRQYRAGIHITGLRTRMVEWSASLGWAVDSDDRNGAYGKLGLLMRR